MILHNDKKIALSASLWAHHCRFPTSWRWHSDYRARFSCAYGHHIRIVGMSEAASQSLQHFAKREDVRQVRAMTGPERHGLVT
jgi:hypothetical protein